MLIHHEPLLAAMVAALQFGLLPVASNHEPRAGARVASSFAAEAGGSRRIPLSLNPLSETNSLRREVEADTLSPARYAELRERLYPLFQEAAFEELYSVSGELLVRSRRDHLVWMARAVAAHRTGHPETAARAYDRAFDLGTPRQPWIARQAAEVQASLGQRPEAVAWLERALAAGLEDRVELQGAEAFAALRDDPEFRRIAGLPPEDTRGRDDRWRYDLDFLVAEARRLHAGPERPARSRAFRDAAGRLRERIPELSEREIIIELQRLVASLGDGHSVVYGIRWGEDPGSRRALPVVFYLFDDGLHVVDAAPGHRELVGSRVLRLGEKTPEDVLDALAPYVNRDNEMTLAWLGVRFFMCFPDYLRAAGATSADGSVRLTVRLPAGGEAGADGTVRTVTLSPARYEFPRKLRPPPRLKASRVPLWLQRVDANYWMRHMPDRGALYFQFNQVRDKEEESIAEFAGRLQEELTETGARSLVVDVRHNNGGNNGLLRPLIRTMIHWEVSDPDHRIYVLTGRNTFSAAQNFVNRLERWTDAVFVGEPSASRPNFTGESTNVVLPYSRLWVSISSRYWQDSDPGDERRWIWPQMPVRYTAEDYFAGRDPVLEAALRASAPRSAGAGAGESSRHDSGPGRVPTK